MINKSFSAFAAVVLLYVFGCTQGQKEGAIQSQTAPTSLSEDVGSGFTVLASGLAVQKLKSTDGQEPQSGDLVTVHFRTKHRNGVTITDSRQQDHAISFYVGMGEVVKGWDEAVRLMKVGEVLDLKIPPSLSKRPTPQGMTGPKDTVFCELELVNRQVSEPLSVKFQKQNNGQNPQDGQVVIYRYEGRIKETGKVFESNMGNANPAWLVMGESGRTIKGVQEALRKMTKGDRVDVDIPAHLGFGKKGYMRGVPANTDLSFTLELVDVKEAGEHQPMDVSKAVKTIITKSGVTVAKLNETDGVQPEQDRCKVSYHWTVYAAEGDGMLTTTVVSGVPLTDPLNSTMFPDGIIDGISALRKGEKARFTVPPSLAWGTNGVIGKLPANTDVLVDFELLDVICE